MKINIKGDGMKNKWAVFNWGVGHNTGSKDIIAIFALKRNAKAYYDEYIRNCVDRRI
jgi:hypothetical protein